MLTLSCSVHRVILSKEDQVVVGNSEKWGRGTMYVFCDTFQVRFSNALYKMYLSLNIDF